MSGIGTGYDLSATTFTPDGRIYQIEYAEKAVENSGTVVALTVPEGVVFGVEKYVISKMLVKGSNRRIMWVDNHIGIMIAGVVPDGLQIVRRAREEASQYENWYGRVIPLNVLAKRIALYLQAYTCYASVRPFGCTIILAAAGVEGHEKPEMYIIEPSGIHQGVFAAASGRGRQEAKTEVEKLDRDNLSLMDAVDAVSKIIYKVHEEEKGTDFELEMGWICAASNFEAKLVPEDILARANEVGKRSLEEEGMDL